jgi:hypothetical protein
MVSLERELFNNLMSLLKFLLLLINFIRFHLRNEIFMNLLTRKTRIVLFDNFCYLFARSTATHTKCRRICFYRTFVHRFSSFLIHFERLSVTAMCSTHTAHKKSYHHEEKK